MFKKLLGLNNHSCSPSLQSSCATRFHAHSELSPRLRLHGQHHSIASHALSCLLRGFTATCDETQSRLVDLVFCMHTVLSIDVVWWAGLTSAPHEYSRSSHFLPMHPLRPPARFWMDRDRHIWGCQWVCSYPTLFFNTNHFFCRFGRTRVGSLEISALSPTPVATDPSTLLTSSTIHRAAHMHMHTLMVSYG